MLYTSKNPTAKFAKFSTSRTPEIIQHVTKDGLTVFQYSIHLEIDKSKIDSMDGNLQLRAFSSQKSKPAITVKRSDVASANFFKKIDRERLNQISSRQYEKKYFAVKNIDRPDLVVGNLQTIMEIPSANVSAAFRIDLINVKDDGNLSTIDSLEINHDQALRQYDIPSVDFLLTVTRDEFGKIYASASTTDPCVGSFKFFLKKNTSSNFDFATYSKQLSSPVIGGNISNAVFEVEDCDQSYTVLARPVSRILEQEIGNFRSETVGFKQDPKQIPFYMSSITDSSVYFVAQGIDNSVSKIFLYRQRRNMLEREFVNYFTNSGPSAFVYDRSRNPQYDYTYTIDYVNSQGVTVASPVFLNIPALKLDGLAKISAKLNVDKQNVTPGYLVFDINVEYEISTSYDKIVEDVKSLGLESLFSSDLEKLTNNIKPFVRVLVSKISTRTGIESDIGVFQPGIVKLKNETADITQAENYIYRFEVAVRSVPETLESLVANQSLIANNSYNLKSINDLSSKLIGNRSKNGQSNFSTKFLTKSSIRGSEIRYGDASNLSDVGFYVGRTGIFSDVLVKSRNSGNTLIKSVKFSTRSKGSYLSWTFSSIQSTIDLFEINVDGIVFYSHVASGPMQNFHLGNISPSIISITAISKGVRIENSTTTLRVKNGN